MFEPRYRPEHYRQRLDLRFVGGVEHYDIYLEMRWRTGKGSDEVEKIRVVYGSGQDDWDLLHLPLSRNHFGPGARTYGVYGDALMSVQEMIVFEAYLRAFVPEVAGKV